MGKFTTWVKGVRNTITEGVAGSVRFGLETFGVAPSDTAIDRASFKVSAAVDKVEMLLTDAIDEIPGVPRIVASLLAAQLGAGLQAAIAAAAEGAKMANDKPA